MSGNRSISRDNWERDDSRAEKTELSPKRHTVVVPVDRGKNPLQESERNRPEAQDCHESFRYTYSIVIAGVIKKRTMTIIVFGDLAILDFLRRFERKMLTDNGDTSLTVAFLRRVCRSKMCCE